MNLREKHCTKRRKSASNRKKEIHLRRGQCTRYSSTRAESCYKKTREDGKKKAWLENTIENLCSLRSADLTRESDRTPSCVVSQTSSWLTHLISSASSRRCISRTLKLCLTLPTPLILPLVTFSCSRISPKNKQKMSCCSKIQLHIIPRISQFSVSSTFTQNRIKQAFLR